MGTGLRLFFTGNLCMAAGWCTCKTKGAYNTKSMKSVFLSCGFKDVTSSVNLDNGSGMKRGDVLLKHTPYSYAYRQRQSSFCQYK